MYLRIILCVIGDVWAYCLTGIDEMIYDARRRWYNSKSIKKL